MNLVRNHTEYDTHEVARLIRATLRDLEVDDVCVTVRHRGDQYVSGRYREYWWPHRGEDRPQITLRLPRPGIAIADYHCYARRDAPEPFALPDWQTALVAITAHEGMHHRQTPRHAYGRTRGVRYREAECDWAAVRAVRRYTAQREKGGAAR